MLGWNYYPNTVKTNFHCHRFLYVEYKQGIIFIKWEKIMTTFQM